MRVAVVIPARFDARRLPGKPLLAATGRPMIAHVVERALMARTPETVIVATDHDGVADAARAAGAGVVLTRRRHDTGSERVAEAAAGLDADVIINVQGDEPELDPHAIDAAVDALRLSGAFAATLAAPINRQATGGPGSPEDAHAVKAYLGSDQGGWRWARWFTRAAPHRPLRADDPVFLHLGVYAFPKRSLARFAAWPRTPIERFEGLEQLRILEHGENMAVAMASHARPGIDTAEDYAAFVARWGEAQT